MVKFNSDLLKQADCPIWFLLDKPCMSIIVCWVNQKGKGMDFVMDVSEKKGGSVQARIC